METIDLHGVKHGDVGKILDTIFWNLMQSNQSSVKIITGNSETMKQLVRTTCDEYGFIVVDEFNLPYLIINLI